MRILQLHSNFVLFTPVEKEISTAEEAEKKESRIEEVVLLLTAVEEGDDASVVQMAVNDIRGFLGKLKLNRILIYPYAHLSNRLAKPARSAQTAESNGRLCKTSRHRNLSCSIRLEQAVFSFC